MELNSLRYFICVADNLSFSQAARQLYISQPALSYHISNLEKELGAQLFIRDKRKITLTKAGEILLKEAGEICEHADTIYRKITALSSACADTLRFGFVEMLISTCFNRFISPFLYANPDVHGVMERCSNVSLLDDLVFRKVYDFAFTRKFLCDLYGSREQLSCLTILPDSISIVVPQSHPYAHLDAVEDLSILAENKLLMLDKDVSGNCYDPCFKLLLQAHGYPADTPDYWIRNMDDLLGQVAAGRGISIVPFHRSVEIPFNGVKLIQLLGDDVPSADIVAAWCHTDMTAQKEQFLQHIRGAVTAM